MVFQEFTVNQGESPTFVIEFIDSPDESYLLASPRTGDEAFQQTSVFWQRWLGHCQYDGRWREMVHRSALTLKLLTYAPTDAIVAAPVPGEFLSMTKRDGPWKTGVGSTLQVHDAYIRKSFIGQWNCSTFS